MATRSGLALLLGANSTCVSGRSCAREFVRVRPCDNPALQSSLEPALLRGRARPARPRDCAAVIDHIWLRVGDLEASKRFWVTIGPALGLHISRELPARFHVAGSGRSFALVDGGDRTRDVHIAFPAASTPWSASFT